MQIFNQYATNLSYKNSCVYDKICLFCYDYILHHPVFHIFDIGPKNSFYYFRFFVISFDKDTVRCKRRQDKSIL